MTRVRFSTSLYPPEPARTLTSHLLRAAASLSELPSWIERYPVGAMSPSARQLAWAVGRKVTLSPDHGFRMAALVPPESVGSLWPLYRSAPDLATMYERYPAFSLLLLDFMTCSVVRGERSVFIQQRAEPAIAIDRAEEDCRAAVQVRTWRALHRSDAIAPVSVHFTYPRPASTRRHERVLGTRALRFSQPVFQLELSRAWWRAPLPTADASVFAQHWEATCQAVRDHERAALTTRVDAAATALLRGDLRAATVASSLGMSERTLRRRLAASGHTLRALIEQVRGREQALCDDAVQLAGPDALPVRQRAQLLGYTGTGALRNALRRWRARASS